MADFRRSARAHVARKRGSRRGQAVSGSDKTIFQPGDRSEGTALPAAGRSGEEEGEHHLNHSQVSSVHR